MPTTNARGHIIPTGTEASFSRATIFTSFGNSIRDVVPVANTSDRSSKVTALTNANQGPTSARPLVVYRHDAPGLHRLEWTIDGTVWIPSSGVLFFATKSAADSFGTANGAYLTTNDRARVGVIEYRWTGTEWTGVSFIRGGYVGSSTGGTVTINHGLGIEPANVQVTDRNDGDNTATRKIAVVGTTATQIQFVVYNNGAPVNIGVRFDWVAFA